MRDQIKGYLSRLMRIAMDHDLIDRNPVEGIRFNDKKKQRTRENTGPWTHEEFEQRLQLCLDAGRPSIALALLIGYETGQRPESIDQFRRGHHYDEIRATFAYNQSKTNAYVAIPATERLKHWIGHYGGDDYLIVSEKTGRPYSSDALQDAFKTIQRRAGVEVLKRRYLRHTCVCRLADAGCDVPEIASVTGHTLSSANQILSHYWRPTQTQAANAIQRREQYENAERLRNRVQTMDQSESKLFAFEEEQNSRKPILKQVK
jgi:integrase